MFRYRLNLPEESKALRYGVPQAEALTIGTETKFVYLISGNNLLVVSLPVMDETTLTMDLESPISKLDSAVVATFDNQIQSICSFVNSAENKEYVCGIDEKGVIRMYTVCVDGKLDLLCERRHLPSGRRPVEESWCLLRFSPSGKRLLSLHGLSSSLNIFSMDRLVDSEYEPTIIPVADHPRSACWRDDDTVVVTEHLQLSQFYIGAGGEVNAFNRVNVGTNDITCVCAFNEKDIVVACTATDRGVFGLNSRNLKIVKRWRAPIRNTVVGSVPSHMHSTVLNMEVDAVFMCGDDNEVLMYNYSAKEEKESVLKERHTINVRSRSRIIGLSSVILQGKHYLVVLGQNGDLDFIQNPCDYMMERRRRKVAMGNDSEEKRALIEE